MIQMKFSNGLITLLLSMATFILAAQEKNEKSVVKLDLAYYQLNNDLPVLKVSAKTKKERKFVPVEGVEVNLFFEEESTQGFMGRVKTNTNGVSSLTLPLRFAEQWNALSSFTFIATLTQNDHFEDQSTELEIAKAKVELTLEEVDSVRTIKAKLLALQDRGWVPVPETEVKLVVRRLLSDLTATEEETLTTDENGEVSSEFSLSIPGDAHGNIILGAKIDDHETYGSLVSAKPAKWGLSLVPDDNFEKRTLWATRDKTPLWLLIFPNLIIVGVWGVIFYLIYQVIRMIKLGKARDQI